MLLTLSRLILVTQAQASTLSTRRRVMILKADYYKRRPCKSLSVSKKREIATRTLRHRTPVLEPISTSTIQTIRPFAKAWPRFVKIELLQSLRVSNSVFSAQIQHELKTAGSTFATRTRDLEPTTFSP